MPISNTLCARLKATSPIPSPSPSPIPMLTAVTTNLEMSKATIPTGMEGMKAMPAVSSHFILISGSHLVTWKETRRAVIEKACSFKALRLVYFSGLNTSGTYLLYPPSIGGHGRPVCNSLQNKRISVFTSSTQTAYKFTSQAQYITTLQV